MVEFCYHNHILARGTHHAVLSLSTVCAADRLEILIDVKRNNLWRLHYHWNTKADKLF